HVLNERQGDGHLILTHRTPDGRKSLIEAGERVDAEQSEQTREPPGVVDVGEAQAQKPAVGVLPVFLNIDVRPLTLLDDRPDRGGHGQGDKQEHGQFDRSKKLDQFPGKLFPPQSRCGRAGNLPLSDDFGFPVHSDSVLESEAGPDSSRTQKHQPSGQLPMLPRPQGWSGTQTIGWACENSDKPAKIKLCYKPTATSVK